MTVCKSWDKTKQPLKVEGGSRCFPNNTYSSFTGTIVLEQERQFWFFVVFVFVQIVQPWKMRIQFCANLRKKNFEQKQKKYFALRRIGKEKLFLSFVDDKFDLLRDEWNQSWWSCWKIFFKIVSLLSLKLRNRGRATWKRFRNVISAFRIEITTTAIISTKTGINGILRTLPIHYQLFLST